MGDSPIMVLGAGSGGMASPVPASVRPRRTASNGSAAARSPMLIRLSPLGRHAPLTAPLTSAAPRNTNWSAHGKWVHLAKIGFAKYALRKVRRGESEPFYESLALHVLGVKKLRLGTGARP